MGLAVLFAQHSYFACHKLLTRIYKKTAVEPGGIKFKLMSLKFYSKMFFLSFPKEACVLPSSSKVEEVSLHALRGLA